MPRTFTVASHKGGVGKTTTTLNLGFSLSRLGCRVLLVDADPQGGLASATALERRARGGLVQVLRGELRPADAVLQTRDAMLSVVGAGVNTAADAAWLEQRVVDGTVATPIAELGAAVDYVLIDAPAGVGSVTQALLALADGLVAPMSCRALSVRGLPALLKALEYVMGARPGLGLEGVLATMVEAGNRGDLEVLEELRQQLPEGALFQTVIPHDPTFELASIRSQPVAVLPGAARAAKSYFDLALEVRQRELAAGPPSPAQPPQAARGGGHVDRSA